MAVVIAAQQLITHARLGEIPGTECAENAFVVVGKRSDGSYQQQWTGPQAAALVAAARPGEIERDLPILSHIDTQRGRETVRYAYVTPGLLPMLCVQARATGSAQAGTGAMVSASLWDRLREQAHLQIGTLGAPIVAVATEFRGPAYHISPQDAWFPAALGAGTDDDIEHVDQNLIHVWAKPAAGASSTTWLRGLFTRVQTDSTMFDGVEGLVAIPNLEIGAANAARLREAGILLGVIAVGISLLALLNMAIYQGARLEQSRVLANTLASLGIPPRSLAVLVVFEPLAIITIAVGVGLLAGPALATSAANVLSVQPPQLGRVAITGSTASQLAVFAALLALAAILARRQVFLRRTAPARGRSKRRIRRALPWALAVQASISMLLLSGSLQALIGLQRSLPADANFPLEGLTLLAYQGTELQSPIYNPELRWNALMQEHGPPGFTAALATQPWPVLDFNAETGVLKRGDRVIPVGFNRVTSNFFSVLGLRVSGEAAMHQAPIDVAETAPRDTVLNAAARDALLPEHEAAIGFVTRAGGEFKGDDQGDIIGTVDERARTARSEHSLHPTKPTAFVPISTLTGVSSFSVLVRHPAGLSALDVERTMRPVILEFMPGVMLDAAMSAKDAQAASVSKETSMSFVLTILASAAFVVGLLGAAAIVALTLTTLRTELAIAYATGATRLQCLARMLPGLLTPFAVGVLAALLPGAFIISEMGSLAPGTRLAGTLGTASAGGVLAAIAIGIAIASYWLVRRARFMDWLRYE